MLKKYSSVIAFLMLMIFFQKTCISLWVHDWTHVTNKKDLVQDHETDKDHVKFNCTCIDDFFAPIEHSETASFFFQAPVYSLMINKPILFICSVPVCLASLRGPPDALYI